MPKTLNVTIPDDVHEILEQIKTKKQFENNAEALSWIIRVAAEVAEKEASKND